MKQLSEHYKINLQFSSPHHHSTNGLIERQFRTVRDYITTSINDKRGKTWVDILPEIEFTLNATVQKSIGMSPAEVVFGFRINRQWNETNKIIKDREEILETVKNNQKKIRYNNDRTCQREFQVGEYVLSKVEGNSTKDANRYEGPLKILQKRHDRSYILEGENGKKVIRNIAWLKPFKGGGCEI